MATNFFEQQDIARRNTRLLLVLFLAAVLVLIALTNAAVAAFLWFGSDYNIYAGSRESFSEFLGHFGWQHFASMGVFSSGSVSRARTKHAACRCR